MHTHVHTRIIMPKKGNRIFWEVREVGKRWEGRWSWRDKQQGTNSEKAGKSNATQNQVIMLSVNLLFGQSIAVIVVTAGTTSCPSRVCQSHSLASRGMFPCKKRLLWNMTDMFAGLILCLQASHIHTNYMFFFCVHAGAAEVEQRSETLDPGNNP